MKAFVFDLQRFGYALFSQRSLRAYLSDETINVSVSNSTVYGFAGDDSIYNDMYDSVTVSGGAGDDTITNYIGYALSISGGTGDDVIYNIYGYRSEIHGDAGDDFISLSGSQEKVTVNGGEDDDIIYGSANDTYGVIYQFTYGDGEDLIYNYKSIDTVSIGGSYYYSTLTSGNNVIITIAGGGATTLVGASGKTINITGGILSTGSGGSSGGGSGRSGSGGSSGGSGGSSGGGSYSGKNIRNSTTNTLISGSTYADTLTNYGGGVTIRGGAGNDYIYSSTLYTVNSSYGYVTIDAGEGNDTIYSNDPHVSINAGAGDDSIYSYWNATSITINGGEGADTITSSGLINGGAGNDNITANYNATVNGGMGNDSVSLSGNNVIQFAGGDGADTIYNYSSDSRISLPSGAYYTRSTVGSNVIISLVSGGAMTLNDASDKNISIIGGVLTTASNGVINNYIKNTSVNGTSYRDTINNYAGGVTIKGGAGNDSIYNSTSASYTINNSYGYVTIDAGDGDDSIYSNDPYVSINAGAGDDSIYNYWTSDVTTDGGAGNDTLDVYGGTVKGGAGNDRISLLSSSGNHVIQFAGGDGYDTVYNYNSADQISLPSGAYYTRSTVGSNVIITLSSGGAMTLSGASDKTINITGGIPSGGSNSRGINVSNYNDNSIVSGSSYADTIYNYGDTDTINAGNGNDTIYNDKGDYASINAGAGNDSIDGNNDYTTVNAGAGNDTISGNHWKSQLNGGDDNDLISITSYWYNTINGGEGADTIYAGGGEHSVNGGAGNDRISLSGDNLTVRGGTGNDTIYGDTATKHLYQYSAGDGSDIIYNWSSNDTLTIAGGNSWSTTKSGNNIVVNIANSGKVTLGGANGKTINIYPSSRSNPPATVPSANITPQEIIRRFMYSLDITTYSGAAALNEAIKYATGGYFTNIQAAINQMIIDRQDAGSANNFLKNYCGIDLDNNDTGAITGYDAGGSTYQKNSSGIVPESGNVNSFTNNTFSTGGLTIRLARFDSNKNPTPISYTSLSNNTQKYIWQALKTWWASGALDLISNSYGNNYGFNSNSSATVKEIYFGFVNENNGALATTYTWFNTSGKNSGKATQLAMTVNMNYYGSLTVGNSDGKSNSNGVGYLDRTLAHEFTHAVMSANITNASDLPQFIKEGMSELTHGIDDERTSTLTNLAGNVNMLNNSVSIFDTGTGINDAYAGGYIFLRWLAKQGAEHYPSANSAGQLSSNMAVSNAQFDNSGNVTIKGSLLTLDKSFDDEVIDLSTYSDKIKDIDATALAQGIMIFGNENPNSIVTGSGNDTIIGNTGNDKIFGGAGNDILCGDSGNDVINGNAGNDTINGGTGNDTLKGDAGNDIFVFGSNANNDLILDYTSGQDKIKLSGENISVTSASVSGNDVVLTLGMQGKITVKDAKGQRITIINPNGEEKSSIYGGKADVNNNISSDEQKVLTVTNSTKSPVTVAADIRTINASKRTTAVKITGNTLANTISGGKGNDTLSGGAGNDSILGNAGADKLYGNAGADKIYGGAGNDSLWGNAGNDSLWGGKGTDVFTFFAGGGTDYVMDYESGELLRIYNKDGTAKASFSKYALSNDKLTLSIDGGGTIILNDVSKYTNFNINGSTYIFYDSNSGSDIEDVIPKFDGLG